MAEYIDKTAFIEHLKKDPLFPLVEEYGLTGVVESFPSADVQTVVYCKDCKHRDPEDKKCDCGELERAGCIFTVDDDYFCAYGAKME